MADDRSISSMVSGLTLNIPEESTTTRKSLIQNSPMSGNASPYGKSPKSKKKMKKFNNNMSNLKKICFHK